jgi:hypothetical protein
VDEEGPDRGWAVEVEVMRESVRERAALLVFDGMNEEAFGFVEDEEVFVFVKDVERHLFGQHRGFDVDVELNSDAIAQFDTEARVAVLMVEERVPVADLVTEIHAREVWVAGEEEVEEFESLFAGMDDEVGQAL